MCNVPAVTASGIIKRYYIKNNKIMCSGITNNAINISEFSFEQQNISDIIIHNIEIQFALYQFFVMYSDVENKDEYANYTIHCQICYPSEENSLSNSTLSVLLSVFDSIIVDYQKSKTIVLGQFSDLDSKMKIYDIYKELYEKSLLNPFIMSFLDIKNGHKIGKINDCIYQYQPCEDDMENIVLNKEELAFIEFINQQLTLSDNHIIFYCLGWNDSNIEASMTMKKLKKYFKKIFFLSAPDRFFSSYLIINNQ
ncbi:hypothetical protein CDQ84_11240 [Clostridium thermosuccinogenes]|jgi:hypothetical protein|uniref:Uncharacterized protein n=2 Tax=Clostridium thermosuccinogenes TaxID=84032 RepID=A0A2K2FCV2_9CLOT|nr:hypothetical protein [Pseudoclostridium thermosuccinogenes]PNT96615.1 hypothetical protein CDQ85_11085 [Pseudoclostridium thermosuccinogenes]PNT98377.1 hypothetical protein CDQ84_11240 [Pseudoclostridium thermosuccinogenes]